MTVYWCDVDDAYIIKTSFICITLQHVQYSNISYWLTNTIPLGTEDFVQTMHVLQMYVLIGYKCSCYVLIQKFLFAF